MTPDQAIDAGYKDGHAAGSGRAGQYVVHEEFDLSVQAADVFVERDDVKASEWAAGVLWTRYVNGYIAGYRLGAEGEPLPE